MKEVTTDIGYCSEKNLLYLKENAVASHISSRIMNSGKPAPIGRTLGSITT